MVHTEPLITCSPRKTIYPETLEIVGNLSAVHIWTRVSLVTSHSHPLRVCLPSLYNKPCVFFIMALGVSSGFFLWRSQRLGSQGPFRTRCGWHWEVCPHGKFCYIRPMETQESIPQGTSFFHSDPQASGVCGKSSPGGKTDTHTAS